MWFPMRPEHFESQYSQEKGKEEIAQKWKLLLLGLLL